MSDLFELLRRRQGNWVQWAGAIQELQKQGESSLAIFEETGFTPSQQNQMITAVQVYVSLTPEVASKYMEKGSDLLYELRLLPKERRSPVAEFIHTRQLDATEVREIVKAVKFFDSLPNPPEGFTDHPGDAIAYQVYRSAKEVNDVPSKTRLIARGLQYAHSASARLAIEGLLGSFATSPQARPPRLPCYRFETEELLPRLFPVAGTIPLTIAQFQAIPPTEYLSPFGIVHTNHPQWTAIPSYQVVKDCQDGVLVLTDNETLGEMLQQKIPSGFREQKEALLLLIDRAQTEWSPDHYLVIEQNGLLSILWSPASTPEPIYGRLLLILRQKKYFDETASQELWQIEE
ncbi:MAG: RuBisCO accumulation factor 1 [Pseudanabaenaceae cyanobacterium]